MPALYSKFFSWIASSHVKIALLYRLQKDYFVFSQKNGMSLCQRQCDGFLDNLRAVFYESNAFKFVEAKLLMVDRHTINSIKEGQPIRCKNCAPKEFLKHMLSATLKAQGSLYTGYMD